MPGCLWSFLPRPVRTGHWRILRQDGAADPPVSGSSLAGRRGQGARRRCGRSECVGCALRTPVLQPETCAGRGPALRPTAELGGWGGGAGSPPPEAPLSWADLVQPPQASPGPRRLCALPRVKFQKSGWSVSGFCSHGYCRHGGGDCTRKKRACGEEVLCFNEGLTRWLQIFPVPPLPPQTPAGPVFHVAAFPLPLPVPRGAGVGTD